MPRNRAVGESCCSSVAGVQPTRLAGWRLQMSEKKELAAKIFSVLRAASVLSLVSIGALYVYATYISPSAREDFFSSVALILLVALAAALAAANLLYL